MSTSIEEFHVSMKKEADMNRLRELFPAILKNDLYFPSNDLTDNVSKGQDGFDLWISGEPLFRDYDPFCDAIRQFVHKYVEAVPDSQFSADYNIESYSDGSSTHLYFEYSDGVLKTLSVCSEFSIQEINCPECNHGLSSSRYPDYREGEGIICPECDALILAEEEDADIGEIIEAFRNGKWEVMSTAGSEDDYDDFDDENESDDE